MLTKGMKMAVNSDMFESAVKRYAGLVDPATGDVIPYSYIVIKCKNGWCSTEDENRERAILLKSCDWLKRDGMIDESTNTTFINDWTGGTIYPDRDPIDRDKVDDIEHVLEMEGMYADMIRISYYEIKTMKSDEPMSKSEAINWLNLRIKRGE